MIKLELSAPTVLMCWIATAILISGCQHDSRSPRPAPQNSVGKTAGFITKNGTVVSATSLPLIFGLSADLPQAIGEACAKAAKTLNTAAGKTIIQIQSPQDSKATRFKILWGTTKESEPNHQASTELTLEGQTIVAAEIGIDAHNFTFSENPNESEVDSESVCLHELGHAIGMAHSEAENSFMYPVLKNGQIRRELSPADASNLQQVY